MSTGAEMNSSLSLLKAASTSGVHTKGADVDVSLVRGESWKGKLLELFQSSWSGPLNYGLDFLGVSLNSPALNYVP